MLFTWKDTVVLITGAAKGIGANVARLLLEEENVKHIAILDIDEENGVPLQNELNGKHGADKVKFIKCDVADESQLVGNFESILSDKNNEYVVINNAGILNDSLRTYKKQIEINVSALITGSLKTLELTRQDNGGKGGTIINISSVAALAPLPYSPIYNATKSAVLQFSTAVGSDDYYTRTGVRVITVCFGATDTGLIAMQNMGSFDEHMETRLAEALVLYPGQSVESAARGLIEAYKQGKSASAWLANADQPVKDITEIYQKAYALLATTVFD